MKRCDPNARARCPDGKSCELYAEFADGSWCDTFNESVLKQPMTNADRIRAMSDEELARLIVKHKPVHSWCKGVREIWMQPNVTKEQAWVKWLQEPAKEVQGDV